MDTLNVNTRKRIVYGHGDENAKIMIVGEAPGAKEDRVGKPFQGAAGQLLDKLLSRAGILRTMCWVTNVVKERPPDNRIGKFIKMKGTPTPTSEYTKYEEYLHDEIREVNPNIIIAAGAVPLWALTRQKGITKWRGSVIDSIVDRPDGSGRYKVMPILHPAASFRQYLWQHFIEFDLRKARKEQEFPEIRRTQRNYLLRPSYAESIHFLKACEDEDMHAFDIEVSGGEVSCISFAFDPHNAISIPFMEKGREYFGVEQEVEIWRQIGNLLENPEKQSLGQNVTFDSTFLFRKYGIKSTNLHDTMVAMAIAYPDFPKGLDFITSIYTDMPYYKDEGKEAFNKGIDTYNESFWLYNAKDSIVLMEAFPKLMADLERQGNLETYEKQRQLIQPLLYMAEHGIQMDYKGLDAESSLTEARLAQLETEINEQVGYELNPRSPKQLKEYFYGELGIPPYKNNGKPTTNEGALVRLARGTQSRAPVPVANMILEHRSLAKLKGTYLDMSLDDDHRVRSAMNPVGARTGRLSSSKTIFGTGANLQNQPPIMKKFMLADEQCIAYDIDLGQAENRVVAYISPEQKMIEAFEQEIDIHSRTASYIFNIPEDEVKQMDEEGVMCEDIGTGDYTHRFWGKKANHAFNYGQGYKAFAYQVEIPEHEGKMIHQKYHSAYPGIRKYHNWVQDELRKNGTLTNLFGRKYMFLGDKRNYKLFEEAYAFTPQSTVADIINRRGLLEIYYNQEEYEAVSILNQVHDSIVFEIPIRYGSEVHTDVIMSICKSLETPLEFRGREFVIPCDLSIHPINLKDGIEVPNVTEFHKGHNLRNTILEVMNENS